MSIFQNYCREHRVLLCGVQLGGSAKRYYLRILFALEQDRIWRRKIMDFKTYSRGLSTESIVKFTFLMYFSHYILQKFVYVIIWFPKVLYNNFVISILCQCI